MLLILFLCVHSFAIVPVPIAYAAGSGSGGFSTWNVIDISPIGEIIGYRELTLTISNDMVFKGFVTKLSKEELDKLCQEALDFIGETAEDVRAGQDAYKELVKLQKEMFEKAYKEFGTQATMNSIRDSVANSAPGTSGTAGSILLYLEDINNTLFSGEGDGSTAVSALGNASAFAIALKSGATAASSAAILSTIATSIAKVGIFSNMVKNVMALEQKMYAYTDFLDILQRKLAKYKGKETILFVSAKSGPKPFTLFGETYNETWTLNMSLQKKYIGHSSIEGAYEGNYTIEIEYELVDLPSAIRGMGNVGRVMETQVESIALQGNQFIITAQSGETGLKREIAGTAEVIITSGNCTITPKQEIDAKKPDGSSVSAEYLATNTIGDATYTMEWGFVFTLGENSIHIESTKNHVAAVAPEFGYSKEGESGYGTDVPFDGTMYQRGDAAKDSWKLTLIPQQ